MTIDTEKMKQVTGGNAVSFMDGKPVCPICGAVDRMKIVEQGPWGTAYQCELCRQVSTEERTPSKEEPLTCCPVCGATGAAFQIISDNGTTVRYRCMMCSHETEGVK